MALEAFPFEVIERELIDGGSTRLMKSFSRRLGYLETSEPARAIVRRWLAADGMLANAAELNELGRAMLVNVAAVAPGETLTALERILGPGGDPVPAWAKSMVDLLRSLAWDTALFERSVTVLAEIARADGGARDTIECLFQLYLSGTHAPARERATLAERFLRSPDPARQQIGALALGAMIEGLHFRAPHRFEFGARVNVEGLRRIRLFVKRVCAGEQMVR